MSDDKTKWTFGRPSGQATQPPISGATSDGERTIRYYGTSGDGGDPADATRFNTFAAGDEAPAALPSTPDVGPVVGWIVIVKGPGTGRSLGIGAGQNIVGRGEEARVRLPNVDRKISRSHARIIYDPRARSFAIGAGDGQNLTYVNGVLLETRMALLGGELIELGDDTHVRFVPFCGPDFDWSDLNEKEDGQA